MSFHAPPNSCSTQRSFSTYTSGFKQYEGPMNVLPSPLFTACGIVLHRCLSTLIHGISDLCCMEYRALEMLPVSLIRPPILYLLRKAFFQSARKLDGITDVGPLLTESYYSRRILKTQKDENLLNSFPSPCCFGGAPAISSIRLVHTASE
jgi:hypothetical protein